MLELGSPRPRMEVRHGRERYEDDRRSTQPHQTGELTGDAVETGVARAEDGAYDQDV